MTLNADVYRRNFTYEYPVVCCRIMVGTTKQRGRRLWIPFQKSVVVCAVYGAV